MFHSIFDYRQTRQRAAGMTACTGKAVGRHAALIISAAKIQLMCFGLITLTAPVAFAQEPWIMVERNFFAGNDADAARGQGVTTDGSRWYFSGTHSLEIADDTFNTITIDKNAIASQLQIPSELSRVGLNHIGDIDYANGLLYISLDSSNRDPVTGNKYSNPVFAIYDAETLSFTGKAYALNPPHGVHDIASWVAIDAEKGLAYGIAYDNATELTVYNLADFSFNKYIPLSAVVDQAQGGKILDGWMYFATDNDDKKLMRANLLTGEVETIGNLKLDAEQEVEGLSIRYTKDGWSLNVLNREESVPGNGQGGVAFYKYLRPYGNVLSGEIHSDIAGALQEDSRFLREATNRRLQSAFDATELPSVKDGQSAQDAGGPAFWSEALASTSKHGNTGDAADFDRSLHGLIAGVDVPIDRWRLGFVGSYSRGSFDVGQRRSSGDSDNYEIGTYAGTRLGDFGLRFGAAYGRHQISTKRDVVFPAFAEHLTAEYDAMTAQAFGEVDYRIKLDRLDLSPFAGLAYVHLKTDGFSEDGGSVAALSSDDQSWNNSFSTVGLRASVPIQLDAVEGHVRGMIGWQHAFGDTATEKQLTFKSGADFTSTGVPIAKDALGLNFGMDLALTKQTLLSADYSGQFADNEQSHAVKVNFKVEF
ncbi:autotransporter domain-containing protein [Pleomorphomonas sp. PLEO]|uniref:autotransporter outer membrane beta-barrel domain-containing protein n=1 Tax=Pleomorphomonas sp. PLEO TaxID=3239306 RepID=UPI00351E1C10